MYLLNRKKLREMLLHENLRALDTVREAETGRSSPRDAQSVRMRSLLPPMIGISASQGRPNSMLYEHQMGYDNLQLGLIVRALKLALSRDTGDHTPKHFFYFKRTLVTIK